MLEPILSLILFLSIPDLRILTGTRSHRYLFMSQDLFSSPRIYMISSHTHHSAWNIIFLEQPFPPRWRDLVKSSTIAAASCSFTSFSLFPLPSLPWQLYLFPYENECHPIPSLQSVCSKRRESLSVWVSVIPGTESCLFSWLLAWRTGKGSATSDSHAMKRKWMAVSPFY